MIANERIQLQQKKPIQKVPIALEKLLVFGGLAAMKDEGLNAIEMRFCKQAFVE